MASIFGPLTLGELIAALESACLKSVPEGVKVTAEHREIYFDWCRLRPGNFHSYRGFYDHLAVGIEKYKAVTVRQFLDLCNSQIGARHDGYKGGGYTMGPKTPVWVADASDAPGFGIVAVEDDGYSVILKTEHCDT